MIFRGMTSADVAALQEQLRNLNYPVTVDSVFGPKTEAAVRVFQTRNNLFCDGIVGPATSRALKTAKPESQPVAVWFSNVSVPYFSQKDNVNHPSGTCNVTSIAMVMAALGERPKDPSKQLEDELFEFLESKEAQAYWKKNFSWAIKQGYAPRHIHQMLAWMVERYGYTDELLDNRTITDLQKLTLAGKPVVINGLFTSSGHIVVLRGFLTNGDAVIHDPYGNWNYGYKSGSWYSGGDSVFYPWTTIAPLLRGAGPGLYRGHVLSKA